MFGETRREIVNEKQKRWLISGGIVLLVLILAAIISPGILFPALLIAFLGGLIVWGTMAAEAARSNQATTTQRPPIPVYRPPAEQQPTYAQGYQAQASASQTASWPFTPPASAAEPQPHEARPGERYEDPLVQYPE